MLQYVTFTLGVYQVCHRLGCCLKNGSCSSLCMEWKSFKSMDNITETSYYLNKCWMLLNTAMMIILSFNKTVHRRILRSTQSNCCIAKLSTSFLLSYDPVVVQSLTPVVVRFKESW